MTNKPMARHIRVDRNVPMNGARWPQATVSWPAYGHRTPEDARLFAEALIAAAGEAAAINLASEKARSKSAKAL